MDTFVKALERRRQEVQARIDAEMARPRPDALKLLSLKKLKLHFRDQIEFIQRTDRNKAPVMVVRRRAPFAAAQRA
ncbi:DUF465 domain-containing protein [Aquibium microcysteis]|uniref:DUF465 domain-containing protein n=1 Tax=Aquibium microcysteis TaxID=675281 RepID=UPI00165D1618|nr:DUF465 domain-containing protein [Aquibium microcysteis]